MYTILESRPEVTAEETGVRMMSRCDDPQIGLKDNPNSNNESSPSRCCFFSSMTQEAAFR